MVEKFKKSLLVVAIIFGLVSVLMIFCPAVTLDVGALIGDLMKDVDSIFDIYSILGNMVNIEMNWGFEGSKIVFGWELMNTEVFKFSFLSFIAYLLPIAGIICIVYGEKKSDTRIYYAAIACFAVATLLFFLAPSLIQYEQKEVKEALEDYITLGAGAVIGAISCAISAVCVFLHIKDEGQKATQSQITEEI